MLLTVLIPSFNEEGNVAALVGELNRALAGFDAELLYIDDSTDGTVTAIEREASVSTLPLRVHHRNHPTGGLSGAVVAGFQLAQGEFVVVMDADLQHPPHVIPQLLAPLRNGGAELTVASRYIHGGASDGLGSVRRRAVSALANGTSKVCFPRALRDCTDPMTGFFGVRRAAIRTDHLNPAGFKVLLEILATHRLRVVEVPFVFRVRYDGDSKADLRQGALFMRQLFELRTRWRRTAGDLATVAVGSMTGQGDVAA